MVFIRVKTLFLDGLILSLCPCVTELLLLSGELNLRG